MGAPLKDIYRNMIQLGLASLASAQLHASTSSDNPFWPELSVIQAAHAAEILIKARIAQEHPLLIFETLPKLHNFQGDFLSHEDLVENARTFQFFDLPDRLAATTGVRLQNVALYREFGRLRNSIQHFSAPSLSDCDIRTLTFIYGVIDPLIFECWGQSAIDFNDDYEDIYLVEALIRNEILFTVSSEFFSYYRDIPVDLEIDTLYLAEMRRRIEARKKALENGSA